VTTDRLLSAAHILSYSFPIRQQRNYGSM